MKDGDVARSTDSPGIFKCPDASAFENCPEVRRLKPMSDPPPTELYPLLPPLVWARSRSSSAFVPVLFAFVAAASAPFWLLKASMFGFGLIGGFPNASAAPLSAVAWLADDCRLFKAFVAEVLL